MREIDRRSRYDRRVFLKGAAATAPAVAIATSTGLGITDAWAEGASTLTPATLKTLLKMARDIYPHDRIPDDRYAVAVKGYDTAEKAPMVEAGIAALDGAARGQGHASYVAALWEADRVAVLRAIEKDAFFRTVRAGLVTDLYNQKEIWPLFGYEGESFSHGGYIDRGFNDIAWL